jgi:hypothetical protein
MKQTPISAKIAILPAAGLRERKARKTVAAHGWPDIIAKARGGPAKACPARPTDRGNNLWTQTIGPL